MTYTGFCNELKKEMVVTRDMHDASNFIKKDKVEGLIDCRHAPECEYYKKNGKCELEK